MILDGKTALVTGGGTAYGQEVVKALAKAGASVVVCDVNPTRADAVAAAITVDGGRALGWAADVGNKFQVGSMIEHVRDVYDRLDIVVNVWWVNKRDPFLTLDEYDWRRVIEVNLTGAFLVNQLAARVMADEGGGVIVHVSGPVEPDSIEQVPYEVSRSALKALAESAGRELDPLGVHVAHVAATQGPAACAGQVLVSLQGFFTPHKDS